MSRPRPSAAALRTRLARISRPGEMCPPPVALGAQEIDARIGGGLARAALHELFAADPGDASVVAGFAVLIALRAALADKPVLWLREDRGDRNTGRLYAPGLAALGADANRFTIVHAPDALSLLRAGADIVKCGAVGAVVIEPWGKAPQVDLTASRRLSMAAAKSGVLALLLRAAADPHPSAAQTRWRIAAAPSVALEANAPGPPAFAVELLRHRGGLPGFSARLEWDRDRSIFHEASLSGDPSADAAARADRNRGPRAA